MSWRRTSTLVLPESEVSTRSLTLGSACAFSGGMAENYSQLRFLVNKFPSQTDERSAPRPVSRAVAFGSGFFLDLIEDSSNI